MMQSIQDWFVSFYDNTQQKRQQANFTWYRNKLRTCLETLLTAITGVTPEIISVKEFSNVYTNLKFEKFLQDSYTSLLHNVYSKSLYLIEPSSISKNENGDNQLIFQLPEGTNSGQAAFHAFVMDKLTNTELIYQDFPLNFLAPEILPQEYTFQYMLNILYNKESQYFKVKYTQLQWNGQIYIPDGMYVDKFPYYQTITSTPISLPLNLNLKNDKKQPYLYFDGTFVDPKDIVSKIKFTYPTVPEKDKKLTTVNWKYKDNSRKYSLEYTVNQQVHYPAFTSEGDSSDGWINIINESLTRNIIDSC